MGCNCKVNKKIIDIHKHYGYETNVSWIAKNSFKLKNMLLYVVYFLILLLLFPFVLSWFIVLVIRGKHIININNVFKKFIR